MTEEERPVPGRKTMVRNKGIVIQENENSSVMDNDSSDNEHKMDEIFDYSMLYSDTESEYSDRSIDYLSEGENELIELRKRNTEAKRAPKVSKQKPCSDKEGGEGSSRPKKLYGFGETETVLVHEEFMDDLVGKLRDCDDDAELIDPFKLVETNVDKYPTHDQDTHWKMKKPKVGKKFVDVVQLKECLTYYGLENGFSLWFYRSSKMKELNAHGGVMRSVEVNLHGLLEPHKSDLSDRMCALSKNDLKDLVKTYRIPLDLHPRLPDPGFTMDRLPADAIGIYSEFLRFFGVRVPFSTFLLSVLKYFKVYISQLVPLVLNKVVSFEVVCHDLNIVPNVTLFRVFQYDLPSDGYDRNDVQRLRARLIHLREMREEVLVRFGLSSVWFNKECDPVFRRIDNNAEMSIYDFMTLPSWSDAKIVEESHHLSLPLLERVPSHTTASAVKGVMVPLPTSDEIVAPLPDPRLAKKSKGSVQARVRLDSIGSSRGPIPRLGKRLGAPPSMAVVSASEPSHVGTSAPASISGRSLSLGGVAVSGHARKSGAEYDQIPEDDFGTATRGEEIDLTLFPLAPGPYHMPYPYEGSGCMRKALDRMITPAELRRTESLLLLELSNRVNVISAMLVSHGYELNSRYTNLVSSSAHLQEMLDKRKGDVNLLRSEVTSLDNKFENLQRGCDALGQENRELRSHRDAASEETRKLRSQLTDAKTTSASLSEELTQTDAKLSEQALTEVTQFVCSGVDSLVRKLLSSDEFHAALACVASLGINYDVKRELRMGRTSVKFEAAVQKLSNFHVGIRLILTRL
ncbi:hypothetical protein Tco_0133150 [Tanacetum coccineum]